MAGCDKNLRLVTTLDADGTIRPIFSHARAMKIAILS